MLTSLFNKSRPISYVFIGILLLTVYLLNIFRHNDWSNNIYGLSIKLVIFGCIAFSLLPVWVIGNKHKLTQQNAYPLFFYSCFLILFSTYFNNYKIIIVNLLILLALKRIFSMESQNNFHLKIFDAALWIFAASIFHFWSILFLFVLYFTIVHYSSNDYRNWLIPIAPLFVVTIFFITYFLYYPFDWFQYWKEQLSISFNFYYFENPEQHIALAIFSSIALLLVSSHLIHYRNIPLSLRIPFNTILVCFIVGALIYLLSSSKNNSFLVFTFLPLSILATNYVEKLQKRWMKELFLTSILLLSIGLFISQLF